MRCWPTEQHFASWLPLAPNNKISGGKLFGSAASAPTRCGRGCRSDDVQTDHPDGVGGRMRMGHHLAPLGETIGNTRRPATLDRNPLAAATCSPGEDVLDIPETEAERK